MTITIEEVKVRTGGRTRFIKKGAAPVAGATLPHEITHSDFSLNRADVCRGLGEARSSLDIDALKRVIVETKIGAALFENVQAEIVADAQSMNLAVYSRTGVATISLNPDMSEEALIIASIMGLRKLQQIQRGSFESPMKYEPNGAVLLGRVYSADAIVVAIQAAWELKHAGEERIWEAFLVSNFVDMAAAFEEKIRSDFRSLDTGAAERAAYDRFFQDGVSSLCDKATLHQMLLDDKGYMSAGEKELMPEAEIFLKIGKMVSGDINYLTLSAAEYPASQRYYEVTLRSLVNILWFIDFDRKFRKQEEQAMQESVEATAEIYDFMSALEARRQDEDQD